MRENRTYGSEGGGAGNSTGPSYPYHPTERGTQSAVAPILGSALSAQAVQLFLPTVAR